MRCLALDASTSIGWALFNGPAKLIDFGTWQLTKQYDTRITGKRLAECEDWLGLMIEEHRPDVVGFEAPILPFFRSKDDQNATQSTGDTVRLLVGLATIIDLTCYRRTRRCIEVPVPTAKVRLAGTVRANKRDMVNAAIRRGWLIEDEHQADACAVALCTFDHCGVGELL